MNIPKWKIAALVVALVVIVYLSFPSESELADLYEKDKKYQSAAEIYQQKLAKQPNQPKVLEKLVELYRKQEKPEQEIKALEKLLAQKFQLAPAIRLAHLLKITGNYQQAIQWYHKIVSQKPEWKFFQQLHQLYQWQEQPKQAYHTYLQAEKHFPKKIELLEELLKYSQWLEDQQQTERLLTKLALLQPNSQRKYAEQLAEMYLAQQKFAKAIGWYRRAGKFASSQQDKERILRSLSRAYLWNEQFKKSLITLEKLIQLRPDDLSLRQEIVALYQQASFPHRALDHLYKLVTSGEGSLEQQQMLVKGLQDMGKYPQALQMIQRLQKQNPHQPAYWQWRGNVYYVSGQLKQSAHNYRRFLQQTPRIPEETFKRLNFYYENTGNYSALIANYQLAISKHPQRRKWRKTLVDLYIEQQQFAKAISQLNKLLALSASKENLLTLVSLYKWTEQPQQELKVYKRLKQQYPKDADITLGLANRLVASNQPEQAIPLWEELIEQYPQRNQWREQLGYLYQETNNLEKAFTTFQIFVQRGEFTEETFENYIYLARETNRHQLAISLLEEKLQQEQASVAQRLLLSELLTEAGQISQAEQILENLARDYPQDIPLLEKIALHFFWQQNLAKTRQYYSQILALDAQHLQALKILGQISVWNNDLARSEDYFQRYNKIKKDDGEVHFFLGEVYYEQQQTAKAYRQHSLALKYLPVHTSEDKQIQSIYARILFRRQKLSQSLEIYQKLRQRFPKDPETTSDYLETLVQAKQYAKANYEIETQIGEELASHPRIQRLQASLYIDTKASHHAASVLSKLHQRFPNDTGITSDLGYAHEVSGNWSDAISAYNQVLKQDPDNWEIYQRQRSLLRQYSPRLSAEMAYHELGEDTIWEQKLQWQAYPMEHWGFQAEQTFYSLEGNTVDPDTIQTKNVVSGGVGLLYAKEGWQGSLAVKGISDGGFPLAATNKWGWHLPFSQTQWDIEVLLNEFWHDPVAAGTLEGRKSVIRFEGEHVYEQWVLGWRLAGSYYTINSDEVSDQQQTLGAYEYNLSPSFGYLVWQDDPFFLLSLQYHHLRQSGDDELFDILPMIEEADTLSLNFYYENTLYRYVTVVLAGNVGTDPTRNVSFLYGIHNRWEVFLSEHVSLWVSYEFNSENLRSDTGFSQTLRAGWEILF